MTYTTSTAPGAWDTPPPEPPKRARRAWVPFAAAALVALFVGVGIGQANKPKPKVVTKIVNHTQTRTVTDVQTRLPASCTLALDSAERVFGIAADGFTESSDAITAIQNSDVAGIQAATDRINATATDLGSERAIYGTESADCRAGG